MVEVPVTPSIQISAESFREAIKIIAEISSPQTAIKFAEAFIKDEKFKTEIIECARIVDHYGVDDAIAMAEYCCSLGNPELLITIETKEVSLIQIVKVYIDGRRSTSFRSMCINEVWIFKNPKDLIPVAISEEDYARFRPEEKSNSESITSWIVWVFAGMGLGSISGLLPSPWSDVIKVILIIPTLVVTIAALSILVERWRRQNQD